MFIDGMKDISRHFKRYVVMLDWREEVDEKGDLWLKMGSTRIRS
jgi:hypothetical protein